MASIQADHYALPAVDIVPHLVKIATDVPLEEVAQDIVRAWDSVLAPASAGATIYATFLRKLECIVFGAMLGDDETLICRYLGAGSTLLSLTNRYVSRSRPLLIRFMNAHDDSWFGDSATEFYSTSINTSPSSTKSPSFTFIVLTTPASVD